MRVSLRLGGHDRIRGLFVDRVGVVVVVAAHLDLTALVRQVGRQGHLHQRVALDQREARALAAVARGHVQGALRHPHVGAQAARAFTQEGQIALVPLLHHGVGGAVHVGLRAQAVLRGDLLQQVGIAHLLVRLEAARHAQVHQAVFSQATHLGCAAGVHRQFQRADLAVEQIDRRGAGPHAHAQRLAEIEHPAIEPVDALALTAVGRSDGDEARLQAAQAIDVLLDAHQGHVTRHGALQLPAHGERGQGGRLQRWLGGGHVGAR